MAELALVDLALGHHLQGKKNINKIKSDERKGKHLKADWTFKNCADSFAASELLLQTLAVRTLMASFVFIWFILRDLSSLSNTTSN